MTKRTMFAFALCVAQSAWSQLMPSPSAPAPVLLRSSEFTARSVLFDAKAAEAERARQVPQYVERIVVEGRDPDMRRRPAKPLEQRFAEALLAPPPSPTAGIRMLDTTPCMSVASSWNSLGSSYAPLFGCP